MVDVDCCVGEACRRDDLGRGVLVFRGVVWRERVRGAVEGGI